MTTPPIPTRPISEAQIAATGNPTQRTFADWFARIPVKATSLETTTGTNDVAYITPAGLKGQTDALAKRIFISALIF